jgi:hypothetical protein
MSRKLCVFVVAFMLSAPLAASAQDEEDGGPEIFGKQLDVSSGFITTTSGSSSSTTSTISMDEDLLGSRDLRRELLRDRLEHDRAAVADAVALGAGGALGDLAMIFGVPQAERARLGLALRSRRAALLALLAQPAGGAAEADQFMAIVEAAL